MTASVRWCEGCGQPLPAPATTGRPRRYCSDRCASRTRLYKWRSSCNGNETETPSCQGSVHYSSATDDWATPPDLFRRLEARWGPFGLDVCAGPANTKCALYFDVEANGLEQPWAGRCWMNPPYGSAISAWLRKAAAEVHAGHAELVCCLVPARTDTHWWHAAITDPALHHHRFLRGRVRFLRPGGPRTSAPFPSAVLVFRAVLPESPCPTPAATPWPT